MLNEKRNTKVKGSVLYTVIAVMMIMTVFIFAALSLASAANRRAFNSYANNQTQYTARSVIESVWESMCSNEGFRNQFASLASGSSKDIEVTLPDKSMGKIVDDKAIVTLLGIGSEFGYNSDSNMYKVTATVKMNGQENTLSGYFLAEVAENNPMPFNYALVSLGDSINNEFNNLTILGGASTGSKSPHDIDLRNGSGLLQSPASINGNIMLNSGAQILLSQAEKGIFINGDLSFINEGNLITSEVCNKINYKQLPYVYINGDINYNDNAQNIASENNPVLIMADSLQISDLYTNSYSIYGDVYLYGAYSDSNIQINGLSSGIKQWSGDLVDKRDNRTGNAYAGGNLYSLGTVDVNGGGGNLANNVVANSLNLKTSVTTNGAVVSESVNFSHNTDKYTFSNGLFTNSDKFNCLDNIEINNENFKQTKKVVGNYSVSDTDIHNNYKPSNSTYRAYLDLNKIVGYSNTMDISLKSIVIDCGLDLASELPAEKVKLTGWTENSGIYIAETEFEIGMTEGKITINVNDYCKINKNEDFYWKLMEINGSYSDELEVKSITFNLEEYDIDISGNSEFIKKVNDKVFNANANIIYIDDIDQSVKIEKFIDIDGFTKLKIAKAEFMSDEEKEFEEGKEGEESYTDVGIYYYDTEYAHFLNAVVNTVKFPDSMKKNGSNPPDIAKQTFLDQVIRESESISVVEDEAIEDVEKAFNHIAKAESLVYTFNYDEVSCNDGTVYSGNEIEITSSCTFTGTSAGGGYKIKISPNAKNIYIKLEGFHLGIESEIIVDDFEGTRKVNFLIPKGYDFSINKGKIITTKYNSGVFNITQNPTNQNEIPGIIFYMQYDKENTHEFKLDNGPLITAYIMAPSAKLNVYGGGKVDFSYTINSPKPYSNLSIIGGVVFKDVGFNAATTFAYVNPNSLIGEDGEDKEALLETPECLYYQAY